MDAVIKPNKRIKNCNVRHTARTQSCILVRMFDSPICLRRPSRAAKSCSGANVAGSLRCCTRIPIPSPGRSTKFKLEYQKRSFSSPKATGQAVFWEFSCAESLSSLKRRPIRRLKVPLIVFERLVASLCFASAPNDRSDSPNEIQELARNPKSKY